MTAGAHADRQQHQILVEIAAALGAGDLDHLQERRHQLVGDPLIAFGRQLSEIGRHAAPISGILPPKVEKSATRPELGLP
jgi:hypothetical protein